MRPKTLSFEQLVKQNKQELLEDENSISIIERKLEKRKMELVEKKQAKKEVNI
jgi:Fur-regulated basic protein B